MIILGVQGLPIGLHDAGAALLIDRELVCAVEEERLCRKKRAPHRFPSAAIRAVLQEARVPIADVEVVAYPWLPCAYGYDAGLIETRIRDAFADLGLALRRETKVTFVPHHDAHAWTGILFAERRAEDLAVLALDGSGESTAGALYRLQGGTLEKIWHLAAQSSLGIYYEGLSLALGFGFGDEGKTMGLAAYGRSSERLELPTLIDDRFDGGLPIRDFDYVKQRNEIAAAFETILGPGASFLDRADVAYAAQEFVTDRVIEYLREIDPAPQGIVLTGGLALNCAMNGRVAAATGPYVRDPLQVPPLASDTGLAVGAAVAASPDPCACYSVRGVYSGESVAAEEIVRAVSSAGFAVADASAEEIATRLTEGDWICAWIEGPSEMGPRSLGGRCIIARPDSPPVRDRVNAIKQREAWRPLAPSVSPEEFERSFVGVPSRYMTIAATARADRVEKFRGTLHVDNTARPQATTNPRAFASVLAAVNSQIDVAAVLCTSLNGAGEPIAYRPEDVVSTAQNLGLDAIAGDGWIAVARETRRAG